ncbi:MAG TPA: STAS domain-containing protein [Candidatus Xenobia bacterium]|jgi:anti-anti-sigma factor
MLQNTALRDVGNVKIVDILRDMDFLTAKDIKDEFIRLMNQGHRSIVGNLLAVKLVDSSGLEALATAQIKARSLNIHFSIILNNPNIRKLLATTGLDGFIEIHQTEEEAVKTGQQP